MFIAFRRCAAVTVILVVLIICSRTPAFAQHASQSLELPRTLRADPTLHTRLHQMLSTSPTFREQCERLDAADKLVVLLRLTPTLPKGIFRARSNMRRYTSGLLVVTVEVAPGADLAEWIAHEFEHIIELLDGADLPALVKRQAPGVWRSAAGMIETSRASAAGRSVLMETRTVEIPDNFVE